jgi:hypothetical protein
MPQTRPERGPASRARRGRADVLALARALLVLAALAGLGGWLHGWRQEVAAGEFATIRTDRARLDSGPGWVPAAWEQQVLALLDASPDLRADDRAAVEALAERVAGLSFVEAVGPPRVLWPDGLRLELRLREPVACVHVGRGKYMGVAADGTLLSGLWDAPPVRDTGFLPLVELPPSPPPSAAARRDIAAGLVLDEPAAWDALAVAVSMWRHLAPEDLRRLGRCTIDARRARFASVEEPGTVLRLEGRRSVLFGRSPNLDEPGELPAASKWAHLARALRLLEPEPGRADYPLGMDWDLADLRWDEPELRERDDEGPDEEEG